MAKKYISKYTGPEIDSGLDNIPKLEGKLTELESELDALYGDIKGNDFFVSQNIAGAEHTEIYLRCNYQTGEAFNLKIIDESSLITSYVGIYAVATDGTILQPSLVTLGGGYGLETVITPNFNITKLLLNVEASALSGAAGVISISTKGNKESLTDIITELSHDVLTLDTEINGGYPYGATYCTEEQLNKQIVNLHIENEEAAKSHGLFIWMTQPLYNAFWLKDINGNTYPIAPISADNNYTNHIETELFGRISVQLKADFEATDTNLNSYNIGELSYAQDEGLKDKVEHRLVNLWRGKKLLAIGDSMTAGGEWVKEVANTLGMTYRIHAKGGISCIAMVDGDGSGDIPPAYDPDTNSSGNLYPLSVEDVKDVDIIVLMGFYNERSNLDNKGVATDMYPLQNSVVGRLNYVVKRAYEVLAAANNLKCRVVVASAHRYGKYPYIDKDAYEDGDDLLEVTKIVADRHSLHLIDLMHNGGINRYNWDIFQLESPALSPYYITGDGTPNDGTNKPFDSLSVAPSASANAGKTITTREYIGSYYSNGSEWVESSAPAPYNSDQLHLSALGQKLIGQVIAGEISKM